MDVNGTSISGMIAVCSGKMGNARLAYEIDLTESKVRFILDVKFKDPGSVAYPQRCLDGLMVVGTYRTARECYDAACAVCEGKDAAHA